MADPVEDDNVMIFTGVTPIQFDADVILRGALKANLSEVVIVGYDEDGTEFFSSSQPSGPDVLWMLERAKLGLLRSVDPEDEE